MDLLPDRANLLLEDGQTRAVEPEEVQVGDRILVRPGERLPLDGVVLSGTSQLDTAALTGESLPREALIGDEVLSGCVNLTGVLTIRVTKPFEQSTVSRILEMVETATDKIQTGKLYHPFFRRLHPGGGHPGLAAGLCAAAHHPRRAAV